jgi:hypothetical protein
VLRGAISGRCGSENKSNMLLVGGDRRLFGVDDENDDVFRLGPARRKLLRRLLLRESGRRGEKLERRRSPGREPVSGRGVGHLPISSAG